VDGAVIVVSPPSTRHQEVTGFLLQVAGMFVQSKDLGALLFASYLMHLPDIDRAREPDLLFVRWERTHLITRNHLAGPADLVVEVVSPESGGRDRGEKFVEYEKAGIPEYWLIDPDRQQAEFYLLSEEGRYHLSVLEGQGLFHSKVIPGFWLKVEWLWQSPPPAALVSCAS
jgi:Uma2 family endonuclease